MSHSNRIEEINNLIIEMASGNFDASGGLSEKNDEFDAIIAGINMLGEELKDSTVSRDYLKSIFQGVVDMLIVVDNNNYVIEVNDIVCNILGYSRSEILGFHFTKLLYNKRDKLKSINNKLKQKGFCHDIEKIFSSKSGQLLPVSCSVSLLFDNHKNQRGILYIAKDISRIKKTEEELRTKNIEMDTFVYKAAHDLKGPVASIIGITNFAPMDVHDPTALRYFSMIQDCCEKLDKVLANLREIAAIDKAKKERIKINIRSLLEEVIGKFSEKLKQKDFKVILEVNPSIEININENMFRTIVFNIIDNSIKFSSETDCQMFISVKENKGNIEFNFKDNGIGIKKVQQPRVFNMFYRAHNSKDGSGLGLYIVKTFLNALGGTINLKSLEGKGTTIQLKLPTHKNN